MFILSGRRIARRLIYSSISTPLILLLVLLIPFAAPARGQSGGGTDSTGTGGLNTISGRIYFPSGRTADMRAKVLLESMSSSRLSVLADRDGAFRFKNLGAGSYTVVIDAGEDYDIIREPVFIEGNSNLGRGMRIPMIPRTIIVPIYLRLKANKSEAKPGVLNAALANVPKPAQELYEKAQDAIVAGDGKKAIEHLRAALSIHPDFALAHNSLGVEYLKAGAVDKALEALREAVRLSPEAFVPRLNYGIAYLEKKQFTEAESHLRLALQKNDNSPSAHMYLGITLISLRRYDEAVTELERAINLKGGEALAQAHKLLGGLYWKKGQLIKAADQLEVYLKLSPKAPDAEKIRGTVKELRSKS